MKEFSFSKVIEHVEVATANYSKATQPRIITELFHDKKRGSLSASEYDCICDLLLVPKRYRYSESNADYVEKLCKSQTCCAAFKEHIALVIRMLHNIPLNEQEYVQYGFTFQIVSIMRAIWFNRTIGNVSRTQAIRNAFTAIALSGIYVPIEFIYDFFNDEDVTIGVFNNKMTPYAVIKAFKDENVKDIETFSFPVYVGKTLCSVRAVLKNFVMNTYSICEYKAWSDYAESEKAQENKFISDVSDMLNGVLGEHSAEDINNMPIRNPNTKSSEAFSILANHKIIKVDIDYGICDMSLVYFTIAKKSEEYPIYKSIGVLETYLTSGSLEVFDTFVKHLRFYVKYSEGYMEIPHCYLAKSYVSELRLSLQAKLENAQSQGIFNNAEDKQIPECSLDYYLETRDIIDVVFDVPQLNVCEKTMTQHEINRKGLPQGVVIKEIRLYSTGLPPVKSRRPSAKLYKFLRYMVDDNVQGRIWRNLLGSSLSRKTVLYSEYLQDYVVFEHEDHLGQYQKRISISELDAYLLDYGKSLDLIRKRLRFYVRFDDDLTVEIPRCTLSEDYVNEISDLLRSKNKMSKVKVKRQKFQKVRKVEPKQEIKPDAEYVDGVYIPPPPQGFVILPDNKDESILKKPLSELLKELFH